jgi:ATP-dependent exoDNAse (exonuclease V) alpha subunit
MDYRLSAVAMTRCHAGVLAHPVHGPAGAGNLNALLQEALTPPRRDAGEAVPRAGVPRRDKVTQLRNNYDKGKAGIFNGTVGVVTGLSLEEQTLTVLTDEDEPVDYDFGELDEFAHAYAVTIHRSQGSEYPAVVIPLTTSSWMMLRRNLLCTGVTRAKELIIPVPASTQGFGGPICGIESASRARIAAACPVRRVGGIIRGALRWRGASMVG